MNGEKRFIPYTKPEWGRELPDGDLNSLVDAAGNNYENGYNFDEKDDEEERANENEEQMRKFEKDISKSAVLAHEMTEEESSNESEEQFIGEKFDQILETCKTTDDIKESLATLKKKMPLDDFIKLCTKIEQNIIAVDHADDNEPVHLAKGSEHFNDGRRSDEEIRKSGYSTVYRENLKFAESSGYYAVAPDEDVVVANFSEKE